MGQIYNSDSISLSSLGGGDGNDLEWEGDFKSTTVYQAGDIVSYKGSSYIATFQASGWEPDDPYQKQWELLARKGDDGEPGPANVLTVGEVTTLQAGEPASAEMTGESPEQVLNLSIPQGPAGGPPNTLTIGTVTTLGAGEEATAEVTGTAPNQVLNFGIPQGNDGAVGFPLVGGPGSTALMQVINLDSTSAPGGGVAGSRLAYAGLLPDGTLMVAPNSVSGNWEIWGVLASKEQSSTTVTLMARTDGTTQLTPTAMLESARLAANVRNCRYSYPGVRAAVDCEILVNGQWHPFTAIKSDRTSWGPIIYQNAIDGMYGEIEPYQG